jgi:hypothetical protein
MPAGKVHVPLVFVKVISELVQPKCKEDNTGTVGIETEGLLDTPLTHN